MFTGSIVALVTPFDDKDYVDYRKLGELIEWHISEKTDAILLCGITGEVPTLSEDEKILILKTAVSVAKSKIPILMGTGCNNTKASVLLTQSAKAIGADGCLVVVPYFNKPGLNGILRHFEEISKVGLPVVCYHHPGRTSITLQSDFLLQLTTLPNIVAVKESSGDGRSTQEIVAMLKATVLSGDDPVAYDMLKDGAKGIVSVMANLVPRVWHEYTKCFENKEFDKAFSIHKKHLPLMKAIFSEINPQGIKFALSLMNLIKPNYRLPLLSPSLENKAKIEKEMKLLGLI